MMYMISARLPVDPRTEQGKVRYEKFIKAVTNLGPWSDRMGTAWMVESKLSARQIRDTLKPHLRPNERLFVGQMTNNWAGYNMGQGFPDWIQRRDFDVPDNARRSRRKRGSKS